ncbi:MAG: ABC transporter permease [Ktedonobacteraceae bacterium]
MWQYVFLTLRRRRSQSMLASGGVLIAACALILLSATTQTTALHANQIIHQNWRPSYDLVVLPPTAHTVQGSTLAADSLQGYNGGISLKQYSQIQAIPGVEVAAPLAFIGYIQLPSPFLQFTSTPLSAGYYRVDWTLMAFNGQHHIVERQASFIYGLFRSCDTATNGINKTQMQELQQHHVVLGGCGADLGSNDSYFSVPSLDTGTFLLAAVDPLAEDQLVHLDRSIVRGRMLQAQDGITKITLPIAGPAQEVPLLFHQHLQGQITLHATFSRVTSNQIGLQQVAQQGGFNYLAHLPGQHTLIDQDVPIVQNDPQRFSNTTLRWNGHSWQPGGNQVGSGSSLGFLYTPSGLNYQQIVGPDGKPAYALVPANTQSTRAALSTLSPPLDPGFPGNPDDQQGPEVFFRTLHPLQLPPNPNGGYLAQPVGEFNGDALNAQFSNELNWLPETTYAAPPVVLRYDARGQPVSPTTLVPTTNPAGMTVQPPLALTTLKAATQLKGDHLISVIRVRVSGVNAPNDASWKRVQQVAQLIEQRTGLRALVTLGSSPVPTLVYVPGLAPGQHGSTRTIKPLGWVEERWIALGVSLIYLGQIGQMQLVLLSTLLLVCLGYLIVTLSSLVTAQRRDLAILSALGWRPWQPARLFLAQVLLLALGGGLGGMGLALVIVHLLGVEPPWLIVALTLPGVLVLVLLSSLYPLWQIWRIHPAELLRTEIAAPSQRANRTRHTAASPPSLGSMALHNLQRMRARSLVTLLSLFLSAGLLVIILESLLTFQQFLQGTLLGNYILLQTTVPQLAGALFALVLTFLSVADLLMLNLRERRHEIGLLLALGWHLRHVQQLFVQEGLLLALLGTIPGAVAAILFLVSQHGARSLNAVLAVGLGTILLMILVTVLAAIPALRALTRVQLVTVMRAE